MSLAGGITVVIVVAVPPSFSLFGVTDALVFRTVQLPRIATFKRELNSSGPEIGLSDPEFRLTYRIQIVIRFTIRLYKRLTTREIYLERQKVGRGE